MSHAVNVYSLVIPSSSESSQKTLSVVDTSNIEFEWVIIEPDGSGSDARYKGFYDAAHEALNMPVLGDILLKEMKEDLGRKAMNNDAVNDWLFDRAEEVAAEHGYIFKREMKS